MDDAEIEELAEPEPVYGFRPSVLGGRHEFRLTRQALHWHIGGHSGKIPYDRIRRLRLSFRPLTFASYRFLAEIWPAAGPKIQIASTSWRSPVDQERQDAAYCDFIVELNRRMAAAGTRALFQAGSPPVVYWIGVTVFVAAALALAALLIEALRTQVLVGAALIALFLALFLWQVGGFFRRNRPRIYRPDAIPPEVLPRR